MSTAERDAGAAAALVNAGDAWRGLAEFFVYRYMQRLGTDGCLFEEARLYAESCFHSDPPSPNAWGALALHMSVQEMIERTGRYQQSVAAKSHARLQPLWRVNPLSSPPTL